MKSPNIMTWDDIASLVYEDEVVSSECIRSLAKQLRAKLPLDLIVTIRGEGYKIEHISKLEATQ